MKLPVIIFTLLSSVFTFKILDDIQELKSDAPTPKNRHLIFNDEFDNGPDIDPKKWTRETGTRNKELQYYTDRIKNTFVNNSCLHLKAFKEDFQGMKYTSGKINSLDKFSFLYGTVESKISIPAIQGIFPAFWMLGINKRQVGWPKCGEIDIMEAINKEFKVYMTLHWDENNKEKKYGTVSNKYDITKFHVYRMDWDDKFIRIYIDGKGFFQLNITDPKYESFHKPMYLLYNVAVGGNWPGFVIDDKSLPQEMLVDYIRVYQNE